MSKGKKWSLTALPPKTGCRACGNPAWDFCPDCAKRMEDPFVIHERTKCACGGELRTVFQVEHGFCLDCYGKQAVAPRSEAQKAKDLAFSIAMSKDMDRDNERRQGRLFGRAA